ncbi:TraM recognition domain-containing protein [Actinomadura sp. NPDC048955]|uniref:type IV secretory system conjugative DNA transfer family protein n=1 Tax=Actinomadura sp. NPDC048955 TaxID=3158228 RepID=UPI0033C0293D
MARALGPRVGFTTGGATGGWAVLLGVWSALLCFFIVWLGAKLAATITDGRVVHFPNPFLARIITGSHRDAWPQTSTWLVVVCSAFVATLLGAPAAWSWHRFILSRPSADDPVAALAAGARLDSLKPRQAAQRAQTLRSSLKNQDPRHLSYDDVGLVLGDLKRPNDKVGPALFASWEDTVVAFMAPRSGKTTSQSIPFVLSAPGAVIATSNKADLWAATAELREQTTGEPVWLFDPQHITYQPQRWWWNPLRDLDTVEDASRLAGHFVLTVDDGSKKDLWGPAAQDLLTALFLAAASSGRSLADVAVWLDQPGVPTPVEILQKAGFRLMASSLLGAQNGAIETRDGIYQTARTAAKALRDEEILGWVTPPGYDQALAEFTPDTFVTTRQGLFLCSKSNSPAAPLIAALTDSCMRAGERRAERMGGRLDPPLVVILDEAANICKIGDLPPLYSHLGSRGIVPVTILQSYEQGITVWGEQGMAALWGAATRKIIGAGVDSPRLARDISTLVGQHDVALRSVTYGQGQASEQISLSRREILDPAAIRSLPPGTGLLLATGSKPALMQLRPWYLGPRAQEITSCIRRAEAAITAEAQARFRDRTTRQSLLKPTPSSGRGTDGT